MPGLEGDELPLREGLEEAYAWFVDTTDPSRVDAMLAAAPHRGHERIVESFGPFVLGIARDPEWAQAALFRSNRMLAVFAGRLDNVGFLRQTLGLPATQHLGGHENAWIVVAAFEKWGPAGVNRFRGSFAGFVTDGHALWAFRDHLGTRPLYYLDTGKQFAAATEVKQVLAEAGIPREPNVEYLEWLIYGGEYRAETAFKGVKRFPNRSVAEISTGSRGLRFTEYWNPSERVATAQLNFNDAVEGLREALDGAVSRALTGEDAILLSGGLDSPSLAACAVRVHDQERPIQAATLVYPEYPSVDESEWTRLVADHLGIKLHEMVAEKSNLDDLEYWLTLTDGPVNLLSLPESAEAYRFARKLGARTVLTGEMAEVVFESRAFLLDHLLAGGHWGQVIGLLGGSRKALRKAGWLARQSVRIFAPPAWVLAYRRRQQPRPLTSIPAWMDQSHFSRDSVFSCDAYPARQRWIEAQVAWFKGPAVGADADEICATACGVEVRRPFVDVDLFEYVLSLPASVKFNDRRHKPLLRTAMRGLLPDAIIDRTDKTLFNEYLLAKAEYPTLRRTLLSPRHRLKGIDYPLLANRLTEGGLPLYEIQWARDLARIHAFLDQW
jgi:asparagine synthase (glutamine-hydrolysing)